MHQKIQRLSCEILAWFIVLVCCVMSANATFQTVTGADRNGSSTHRDAANANVTLVVEHVDPAGRIFDVPFADSTEPAQYETHLHIEWAQTRITGDELYGYEAITAEQLEQAYGKKVRPVARFYRLIDTVNHKASSLRELPDGDTAAIECMLNPQMQSITVRIYYQYAYDIKVRYVLANENGSRPFEYKSFVTSGFLADESAVQPLSDSLTLTRSDLISKEDSYSAVLPYNGQLYNYSGTKVVHDATSGEVEEPMKVNPSITVQADDSSAEIMVIYTRLPKTGIIIKHTDMSGKEFSAANYPKANHPDFSNISPAKYRGGSVATLTKDNALTGDHAIVADPLADGKALWNSANPGVDLVLREMVVIYPNANKRVTYGVNDTITASVPSDEAYIVVEFHYGYGMEIEFEYRNVDTDQMFLSKIKPIVYLSGMPMALFEEVITYFYEAEEEFDTNEAYWRFQRFGDCTSQVKLNTDPSNERKYEVTLTPISNRAKVIIYYKKIPNPYRVIGIAQQHVTSDRKPTLKMKSGYSLYATVETGIKIDRVRAIFKVAEEDVTYTLTMPSTVVELERYDVDDENESVFWHFPYEKSAKAGERVYRTITVPKDFPDGKKFIVEFWGYEHIEDNKYRARYCSRQEIEIEGNMFEDDFTARR